MPSVIKNDEEYRKVSEALKAGHFSSNEAEERGLAMEASLYIQEQHQGFQDNIQSAGEQPMPAPQRAVGRGGVVSKLSGPMMDIPKFNAAREEGIDTSTGAPESIRVRSDLLDLKPEAAANALRAMVTEQYEAQGAKLPIGVDPIFKDKNTGRVGFYRHQDGKFVKTLVNPFGPDVGDVLEGIDDVVGGTLEAGAAVAGFAGATAVSGGNVGVGVLGGATAAAATSGGVNKLRGKVAEMLGVPSDVVDQITNKDIQDEAAEVFAWEVGVPIMGKVIRSARNVGKPLGDDVDLAELKENLTTINDAQKRLYDDTGEFVELNVAEMTGSPELAVKNSQVKRDAVNKGAEEMRTQEFRANASAVEALKRMEEGVVENRPDRFSGVDESALGETVQAKLAVDRKDLEDAAAINLQDKQQLMDGVDDFGDLGIWDGRRDSLNGAVNTLEKTKRNSWIRFDGLAKDVGANNVPNSAINKALNGMEESSQKALAEFIDNSKSALVKGMGGERGSGNYLRSPTLGLNELHEVVSNLKAQSRSEERMAKLGWHKKDLDTLVGAIEKQLQGRNYVNVGTGEKVSKKDANAVYLAYDNAKSATVSHKRAVGMKIVERLLEPVDVDGGLLNAGQVRELIFKPKDTKPLQQLLSVIGDNPHHKVAMLKEIDSEFKRRVAKGGDGDSWLNDHREHINLLMGREETPFITDVRSLNAAMRHKEKEIEQIHKGMERAYGKKLSKRDVYVGNVAKDALTGMTAAQIRNVRSAMEVSQEGQRLWKSVQEQGLQDIRQRLTTRGESKISSSTVNRLLANNRAQLEALYGPQYTRNLEDVSIIINAMDKVASAKPGKELANPGIVTVLRSTMGALDPTQRKITGAIRLNREFQKRFWAGIMADPSKLDKLVQVSKMPPKSVGFSQGLIALGLDAQPEESLDNEQIPTEATAN